MPFISVTRLRLRSIRFVPRFIPHALRSNHQVARAAGFREGAVLADRAWTFWTLTVWDAEASMRGYISSGPHRVAMPHLMAWCDEASVVQWDRPAATLPSWPEVDARMREAGRPSRVRDPSPAHLALTYRPPRFGFGGPIHRRN